MVTCRVLKPHVFKDPWGREIPKTPGQLHEIDGKIEYEMLMMQGVICSEEFSHKAQKMGEAAPPFAKTKRIGIWLATTTYYSGGRIHLYQYAWNLADLGAEVYLITNGHPRWANDYPTPKKLYIVIEGKDLIPRDLDMIVTDSKGHLGKKALSWKKQNPNVPFVCFNFETPNWVAEFIPDVAKRLDHNPSVFKHADYYISNSRESAKYLKKWLKKECEVGILPPAINTYALGRSLTDDHSGGVSLPNRPYAIWSARAAEYKGGRAAIDAIWNLQIPFDLAVFGHLSKPPRPTDLHRVLDYPGHSDVDKYRLLRKAEFTLAPSKFEGFGMVPMESLACGTPVIVYDLPVLRQEYGDALHYVKWGDEGAFKKKVVELASQKKQSVSANGIVGKFGMEAQQRRVEFFPYHAVQKKSITAQMICYYGQTVQEALEAVYPYVDQIVIAHGPIQLWKHLDPDNSLQLIHDFPDPDSKIVVEDRDSWVDKKEMRTWAAVQTTGNYLLIVDADEIYVGLDKWIEADIPFGCPRWVHFWHDMEHWVHDDAKNAGCRWGYRLSPFGTYQGHYRWSQWRSSYKFEKHCFASDMNGQVLHLRKMEITESVPEAVIYHLGHVLNPKLMRAKHEFYRNRDGDDKGRRAREKAWHDWKGRTGDCGDGFVSTVNWEVPDIVKRAFGRIDRGGEGDGD